MKRVVEGFRGFKGFHKGLGISGVEALGPLGCGSSGLSDVESMTGSHGFGFRTPGFRVFGIRGLGFRGLGRIRVWGIGTGTSGWGLSEQQDLKRDRELYNMLQKRSCAESPPRNGLAGSHSRDPEALTPIPSHPKDPCKPLHRPMQTPAFACRKSSTAPPPLKSKQPSVP